MDIASLISDINHLSRKFAEQETSPHFGNTDSGQPYCSTTPLAARWLSYEGLQHQQIQHIKQEEQMKALVHGSYEFANNRASKDNIENMQSVLVRLCKLEEQRQLFDKGTRGAAESAKFGQLLSVISNAKKILDDALFKRQQFMIATSDYSKLPDKMADEIIRYLTNLKLELQKK